MERANIVDIKGSGVGGKSRPGHGLGEERINIQRIVKEKRKEGVWMEKDRDRKRGWSQAGRSSGVSCEEAPSVHGSEAPLRTEVGPRQTWALLFGPNKSRWLKTRALITQHNFNPHKHTQDNTYELALY